MKRILVPLFIAIAFSSCSTTEKSNSEEKPVAKDEAAEHPKDMVTVDVATQKSIGLQVQAAKVTPVTNMLIVTAIVKPNETQIAHLKPLSQGRVTQLNVRAGDRIRT